MACACFPTGNASQAGPVLLKRHLSSRAFKLLANTSSAAARSQEREDSLLVWLTRFHLLVLGSLSLVCGSKVRDSCFLPSVSGAARNNSDAQHPPIIDLQTQARAPLHVRKRPHFQAQKGISRLF